MKHVNPVSFLDVNPDSSKKSIIFILLFLITLIPSLSFGQKWKNKDIEPFVDCIEYIGNNKYQVNFGYTNNSNKDISVAQDHSIVKKNNGNAYGHTNFKKGTQHNVFSAEFDFKDRVTWAVLKPGGDANNESDWKITSANSNSNHCTGDFSNIIPLFDGANEGDVLWPELFWLAQQQGEKESNDIFQIDNSSLGNEKVLIEVVAIQGISLASLNNLLESNHNFTNIIPSGENPNPLVLTGLIAISNLQDFNIEPLRSQVNFVRPMFTPRKDAIWTYSGSVGTQQDLAMRSHLVREGFDIDGSGVTIGVISDSYGNPGGSSDVPVGAQMIVESDLSDLGLFSFGTDEGRAMIEHAFDVAPGANYRFRTGTGSPANMAYGINQLALTCDIIFDDVTHLTEPFTPTGQIAVAVNQAAENNVHYVASNGNYGNRGFRGEFDGINIPGNFADFAGTTAMAHNFGGNPFQAVSFTPGIYIVVLQWDDLFYAQGQGGANHDLDFWIVDDQGNKNYFGNRLNEGEDPIEVLGFSVQDPTVLNVMITGENTEGVNFEYIVFKAPENGWEFIDTNIQFNASTVVGHSASPAISSVNAAFYGYTPAFENRVSEMLEPFSSVGGNDMLGNLVSKPDFVAPDGGDNSFFGTDLAYDSADFPNFFGTSAAAPVAAAVEALILQASKKFFDNSNEGAIKNELTPQLLKQLIQLSSLPFGDPLKTGAGLIQADQTVLSMANPSPQILDLIFDSDEIYGNGLGQFTLTVVMQYPVLNEDGSPRIGADGTQILIREEPLTNTTWEWATNGEDYILEFQVDIPTFTFGNPPITIINASNGIATGDGGSVTVNLLDLDKTDLLIKSGNASKKFGENVVIDQSSYEIKIVDYLEEDPTKWDTYTLTPEEKIALEQAIVLSAEYEDAESNTVLVSNLSDVGAYDIKVKNKDMQTLPTGLTEIYNFINFENEGGLANLGYGILKIDPLPVTIRPNDVTVTYGDDFDIVLTYDITGEGTPPNIPGMDDPDNLELPYANVMEYIRNSHNELLAQNFFAVSDANGRTLVDARGRTLVDANGRTLVDARGRTLVDARGRTLVDARGRTLVDNSSWMMTLDAITKGRTLVDGGNLVREIGYNTTQDFLTNEDSIATSNLDNGAALIDGKSILGGEVTIFNQNINLVDANGRTLVDANGRTLVDAVRGKAFVDADSIATANGEDFKLFFIATNQTDDEGNIIDVDITTVKSVNFVSGLDVLTDGFMHYIAPGALLDKNLIASYEIADLVFTPRDITIAVDENSVEYPNNKGKIYGEIDPDTIKFSITSGDLVDLDNFTGGLKRTSGEDAATYDITLGDLKVGPSYGILNDPIPFGLNYNITLEGEPKFVIDKAILTAIADDKTKVYGDNNPEFTITYAGWKNEDGEEDISTLPQASSDATILSGFGSYPIVASGGEDLNYQFEYEDGLLTVSKATLTAKADDKTKVYGDDNPNFTITYAGWKNEDGEEGISTLPQAASDATILSGFGSYPIVASGGEDPNYQFEYEDGLLTVSKATLTAKADDKTKVYGDDNPEFTISYAGWKNEDGEEDIGTLPQASSDATILSGFGSYPIVVSGGEDPNYQFEYEDGLLTVSKATLTAIADDKSKVYGDDNPEFTITYAGWKNEDGKEDIGTLPQASSDATILSGFGSYPIVASGGEDPNYQFVYEDGLLTVSKATLTAKADDKSKVYGDNNPEFTITYAGWKNEDGEEDISTLPQASSDATILSGFGSYPIVASGGEDLNYQFEYEDGLLTVSKATLTAIADDKSKVYGDDNPEFTITYAGWKNEDGIDDLNIIPIISTVVNEYSNAGNHEDAIIISGGSSTNYVFNYAFGDFTINKALLTVTPNDNFIYAGDPLPDFTYEINGFVNGEIEEDVFISYATYSVDGNYSEAGAYSIIPIPREMLSPQNYSVEYKSGLLYVNANDNGARKVKVFCDCIEEVSGDPNGLKYIAHFYYDNPNDYSLNILDGSNNYISGEGIFAGTTPETFTPGIGQVDIRFDGNKIIWNLISYDTNNKTSSTTYASSNTKKCNLADNGARLASGNGEKSTLAEFNIENISGYPNPVTDIYFADINQDLASISGFSLIDMNGKNHDVLITKNHSRKRLEIDLSKMNSGLYLLKLEFDKSIKLLKIMKQ